PEASSGADVLRPGGLAPTIFPLFHGTCLETVSIVLGTSVMMTSSVNEASHSLALTHVSFWTIGEVIGSNPMDRKDANEPQETLRSRQKASASSRFSKWPMSDTGRAR